MRVLASALAEGAVHQSQSPLLLLTIVAGQ